MNILLTIILALTYFSWNSVDEIMQDKSSRKKIDKAIATVIQSESYTLRALKTTADSAFVLKNDYSSGNCFEISQEEIVKGLLYVGSAKGRYDWFDFLVIYNQQFVIQKVEIIVYRSDHGFEIMNKTWLAQFSGTTGCEVEYGKNIDAVSGATLSANSLTQAIKDICVKLQNVRGAPN